MNEDVMSAASLAHVKKKKGLYQRANEFEEYVAMVEVRDIRLDFEAGYEQATKQNKQALELLNWFVNAHELHIREARATRHLPIEINGDNQFVKAELLLKEVNLL